MWLTLKPDSGLSLSQQLYRKIKEMILVGTLASGDKLPSTRILANELSISRNTVLEAYDQLIAEGYLEGHHGSGTVVADGIHKQLVNMEASTPTLLTQKASKKTMIDFRSGIPDLEYFPRKEWAKLFQEVCFNLPTASLRYHSPSGVAELRNAISQYLLRTRGISCTPANIMIVSGSTQGLSLIAKLLHGSKQEVIVEDPNHPGLLKVISTSGYKIIGVPADANGLDTSQLIPSTQTSFVYTTPSHQYPLGGILPIQRRQALIQYALDNECYLVEDDYDSEFRFEGAPINSLYELNPDKVIYLGSFSKILAPAIRLGFILLPEKLLASYKTLKMYTDVHTEIISQYVLASFIQSGGLEKHIWKMKKLYIQKRKHLLLELANYMKEEYEIRGHAAGLHVLVNFPTITFSEELAARIYAKQVKVYPVEDFVVQHIHRHENEIILGYSHLSLSEITIGIQILSEVLHSH